MFWTSAGAMLYAYAGYSLLLPLIALFWRNPVRRGDIEPMVTYLITAYNEEKDIGKKLEEVLSLDYPRRKMEIIVASDGSTDRTDEIVRRYAGRGVILKRVEGRLGKTATQNEAMKVARGEIVIFSDATTTYDKAAIRKIVRNYNDPTVGAVSGRYEYTNPTGAPVGVGTVLFWKYENFIKGLQTRIKTITGCCGCIYSVRKDLYVPLPPDIISDLVEPLKIVENGYRIVFESEAVAHEVTTEKASEEFSMRIRVISRAMRGIWSVRGLLNPRRYPFVSFQLLSHKILRWMVPFFLLVLLVSNYFLLGEPLYDLVFIAQVLCYGAAIVGLVMGSFGWRLRLLAVPLYFCVVNAASICAFVLTLTGKKTVVWETARN
jgi:cellulose synthase/poly-beta-1,6-N-acetylglucosamine synthase-like glycosyltransferase